MILEKFKINPILLMLLAIIALAPVFFGGNDPVVWSLLAFACSLTLLFCYLWAVKNPSYDSVDFKNIRWIFWPFLLVVIWISLQILLNIPNLNHPLWQITAEILPQNKIFPAITLNKMKSAEDLMKLLAYAMIFLVSFYLGRNLENAKKIFLTIIIISSIIAFYGLILNFFNIHKILWADKKYYLDSVSATFINRNSYATYCGISIIISLALLFSKILKNQDLDNNFYQKLILRFNGKALFLLFSVILLFAALILTNSRAGIICSLIGVISLIILFAIIKSDKKYRRLFLFSGLLIILIFTILLSIGGESAESRFYTMNNYEMELRGNIYSVTIEAIKDYIFLGSGFGTFAAIFPIYEHNFPYNFNLIIDLAHNTYLEAMLELGIFAFAFLAISILSMIIICVKGLINRKRDLIFPISAIAVSILVWLHALVDFSIQMPGIAIIYMAIMGTCCAQSFSSRQKISGDNIFQNKISGKTLIIVNLILLILSAYFTLSNIAKNGIESEVLELRSKNNQMSLDQIEDLILRQKAVNKFYQDGNFLQNLAICQFILADHYGYFSESGKELISSAKENLQKGLAKSPASSHSWYRLAYIDFLLNGPSKAVADEVLMSIVTMPYNYKIIKSRLVLAEIVSDFFDADDLEIIKNQTEIIADH